MHGYDLSMVDINIPPLAVNSAFGGRRGHIQVSIRPTAGRSSRASWDQPAFRVSSQAVAANNPSYPLPYSFLALGGTRRRKAGHLTGNGALTSRATSWSRRRARSPGPSSFDGGNVNVDGERASARRPARSTTARRTTTTCGRRGEGAPADRGPAGRPRAAGGRQRRWCPNRRSHGRHRRAQRVEPAPERLPRLDHAGDARRTPRAAMSTTTGQGGPSIYPGVYWGGLRLRETTRPADRLHGARDLLHGGRRLRDLGRGDRADRGPRRGTTYGTPFGSGRADLQHRRPELRQRPGRASRPSTSRTRTAARSGCGATRARSTTRCCSSRIGPPRVSRRCPSRATARCPSRGRSTSRRPSSSTPAPGGRDLGRAGDLRHLQGGGQRQVDRDLRSRRGAPADRRSGWSSRSRPGSAAGAPGTGAAARRRGIATAGSAGFAGSTSASRPRIVIRLRRLTGLQRLAWRPVVVGFGRLGRLGGFHRLRGFRRLGWRR